MNKKIKLPLLIVSATMMAATLGGCVMDATPSSKYNFNKEDNDGILAFSVGCNLGNYSGGMIDIGTPTQPFGNKYQSSSKFGCISPDGNQEALTYVSYQLPAGTYSVDGWSIPVGYNREISDYFEKRLTFNVEKNKVNYIGSIEFIQGYNKHYEMIITNKRINRDFKYFYSHFPNVPHDQYRFTKPIAKKRNWYD